MPRPIGVPSLLCKSLDKSGECIYAGLVYDSARILPQHEGDIRDRQLFQFLSCQPHLIASQICKDILDKYIKHWAGIVEAHENLLQDTTPLFLPSLNHLLSLIIFPNITHLDLSGMLQLGIIDSDTSRAFKDSLCESLQHAPSLTKLCLRTSANANRNKNFLPFCDDDVLAAIGLCCKELVTLDVSYNQGMSVSGIKLLSVQPNAGNEFGCPKLEELYLFDCHLHPKQLANVLHFFPSLTEFGCKTMGTVLSNLLLIHEGKGLQVPRFKFTSLSNIGGRSSRNTLNSLRARPKVIDAFLKTNPGVSNIKLRVHDNDVEYLSNLKCLEKVELLFNTGVVLSPGDGTRNFLTNCGSQLTSLTIICNRLSATNIETVGVSCPALKGLWLRCNEFVYAPEEILLTTRHDFLKNVLVLYFRIGEVMTSVGNLRQDILPFLLCNGQKLQELFIAIRSPMVCGSYIANMLREFDIASLTKLMILVPGLNNLPKVLNISKEEASEMIYRLPELKKLGNLISWKISDEDYVSLCREFKDTELDIVRKISVFN